MRNAKDPFSKRQMLPEVNVGLHKGMKAQEMVATLPLMYKMGFFYYYLKIFKRKLSKNKKFSVKIITCV